ncbi:hypothetical protein Tco_1247229 [Tanacetum coccineum]
MPRGTTQVVPHGNPTPPKIQPVEPLTCHVQGTDPDAMIGQVYEICPRLPNQEFHAPPSDEEIVTFIKELGHKSDIKSITDVVVDQMHQPWRTFASIIKICLSGKITGLYKIRLSRAQILWGMYYSKNVDFVELL